MKETKKAIDGTMLAFVCFMPSIKKRYVYIL